MTQKGKYLAHSDTIFFIMSLIEADIVNNWNHRTMQLLDRYIHVVYSRYGADLSKKQNIVFIFTKSDTLAKDEGERKLSTEVSDYFNNGTLERFNYLDSYTFSQIKYNSDNIENWLRANKCNGFINLAKNHFRSVSFVLVSSLGNAPVDNKLAKGISPLDPKCVLDPFLWALHAPNIKVNRKWFNFIQKS